MLVIHTDGIPTTGCAALPDQVDVSDPGLVDALVAACVEPASCRTPTGVDIVIGGIGRTDPDLTADAVTFLLHSPPRCARPPARPVASIPNLPRPDVWIHHDDRPRAGDGHVPVHHPPHGSAPGAGGGAAGSPGSSVVVDTTSMGALVPANDPPAVFTAAEDAEVAEGHSSQRTIERTYNRALSKQRPPARATRPRPRAAQGGPAARSPTEAA